MTWMRLLLVAALFGLILRAAGLITIPLIDPSEGRYAASAYEMVDRADWITPRVYVRGEAVPYLGKPPLGLWLSAAAMRIGGPYAVNIRLPGYLAMLLMLALIYRILRRYDDLDTARVALGLCGTAPVFLFMAGVSIPDVLLTAAVAGAYCAYYAFLREGDPKRRSTWSLLLFFLAGAGFMIKGPVALVMIGLPVACWTIRWRRWDTLKQHAWLRGGLLFLVLTVPWFVLCERQNPGFLNYFFIHENVLRFIRPEYGDRYGQGHQQIIGAAAVYALALSAPWSVWAIALLARKRGRQEFQKLVRSPERSFFLWVALCNTLFWCLSRNYLPTYLLPIVPAICIPVAMLLRALDYSFKPVTLVAMGCVALVGGASLAAPILPADYSSRPAGRWALQDAAQNGRPAQVAWIRKTPNSAFFYFREVLIEPPYSEAWDEALAWFFANRQCTFISNRKYIQDLPETVRKRISIRHAEGSWVIFTISAQ